MYINILIRNNIICNSANYVCVHRIVTLPALHLTIKFFWETLWKPLGNPIHQAVDRLCTSHSIRPVNALRHIPIIHA